MTELKQPQPIPDWSDDNIVIGKLKEGILAMESHSPTKPMIIGDWNVFIENVFLEKLYRILTHETIHRVLFQMKGRSLSDIYDNVYELHRKSKKYEDWKLKCGLWELW